MARKKKPEAEQVVNVKGTDSSGKLIVFWKATRPFTVQEHEALSEKLRFEEEKTGLTITLVPFTVEVDVE